MPDEATRRSVSDLAPALLSKSEARCPYEKIHIVEALSAIEDELTRRTIGELTLELLKLPDRERSIPEIMSRLLAIRDGSVRKLGVELLPELFTRSLTADLHPDTLPIIINFLCQVPDEAERHSMIGPFANLFNNLHESRFVMIMQSVENFKDISTKLSFLRHVSSLKGKYMSEHDTSTLISILQKFPDRDSRESFVNQVLWDKAGALTS